MEELQKKREEREEREKHSPAFFRTASTGDISRTPPPKRECDGLKPESTVTEDSSSKETKIRKVEITKKY